MAVHAESVIPLWLNDYRPDFYTSITDKENYAYTTVPADKTYWKAEFTNLSASMNAWKNINREASVSGLVGSIHTYLQLHLNFGIAPTYLASMQASTIFSMNDFIPVTISRPTSYYNDMPIDLPFTSPKITADIAAVANNAVEANYVNAAQNNSKAAVGPFISMALFVDVKPVGPAAALDVTLQGAEYTDGTYTNLPLTTVSGTGSDAVASLIEVRGGKVIIAIIGATRGTLYSPGTMVTATLPGGAGFQAKLVAVIGAGKQDIGEYLFNDLEYKKVYTQLNVGSLQLPPYIT